VGLEVDVVRQQAWWAISRARLMVALGSFFILYILPASSHASTYYVDFANGSDTNSGADKTTPWKHAPGMTNCSGTCNSVALGPGDAVIFKGGVTWDQTCFPFTFSFSGTASNRIRYSVDQAWFSGSAWTRPIFDGFFHVITGGSMVVFAGTTQWVTFDNIEVRNLKVDNSGGRGLDNSLIQFVYGAANITVQNCLVHSIQVTTTGANSDQQFGAIYGLGPMTNTVVDHCTIYNDQGVANTIAGLTFNIDTVTHSVIHDGIQGVFGSRIVHDNTIYNILVPSDPNSHPNALQVADANSQIYNNIVHDANFGTCIYAVPSGSVGNVVIYNNVVWNTITDPITLDSESISGGGISVQVFNNTLNGTTGTTVRTVPRPTKWATVTVENNYYISDAASAENFPAGSYTVLVDSKNLLSTQSQAGSQGYTAANQFAPTQSTGATIGAGLNLASVGIPGLDFDIKGLARPTTAWDAGAYQFAGGSNRPAPPSNLAAIVQ
jgi:hypothetical protein